MPHCRNLAGHCPGSHCCGDCLFPEGSAPHSLKADHQFKALEIKRAGRCINQIATEHILFLLTEYKSRDLLFFITLKKIFPEYTQGGKQAVMWFAIIYRMQKFSILKPKFTICFWQHFCTIISTYSPHSNYGLYSWAHKVHIYMQNSIQASCILFATPNLYCLMSLFCVYANKHIYCNTNPKQKYISKEIQGLLITKTERYILPLGLSQELPHCRRLASVRISMTRVANSWALNLANFWRPWFFWGAKHKKGKTWHHC